MSTGIFLLDAENERFLSIETREHSAYRPHGYEAARRLGSSHPYSYGPHWFDHPELLERHWTIQPPGELKLGDVIGGIDETGGSWLSFNRATGVYCRLFTDAGSTGEFASPGALTVTAAAAASAEEAAALLTERLVPALGQAAASLPGFHLLIADHRGGLLVHFDGKESVTTQPLPAGQPTIIGPSGIDTTSGLALSLLGRLAQAPAPGRQLSSWGPWIAACQSGETPEIRYGSEDWSAFRFSVFQPPYISGGPNDRRNASLFPAEDRDRIEWTKSVSLYAAGRGGTELFAYNERQLINDQPLPTEPSRMGFPVNPNDFFTLIAGAES